MSARPGYPAWVKVGPGHWQTEEQVDGTPDYVAIRTATQGWWVKWRSSAQATVGFNNIQEVKDYVQTQQA